MLLEISIKSTILWTCVSVFIVTSIITLLALTRIIKLASPEYLKRLFYALILEVVAISIWGFADAIKGGKKIGNYVKITTPSPWSWTPDSIVKNRTVFFTGIFFKESENYILVPKISFNQREYKTSSLTFDNEMFTGSVVIPGDTSGNLTVNIGLFKKKGEKTEFVIADEVVTPIRQE